MANTYDFYKPKLDSEYPEVDGPLSITTYLSALDASYSRFREKTAKAYRKTENGNEDPKSIFSLDTVDYPIFHSPYGKLVQKGHARLLYNDFLSAPNHPKFSTVPEPEKLLGMAYKASLTDKSIEKQFVALAGAQHKAAVLPSMHCAKRCGNMYTASLYGGLASLISAVSPENLRNKRLSMFAYGSGCASSFYVIRVKGDTTEIREKMDLLNRLESMKVVPCQDYVDALKVSFFFLSTFLIHSSISLCFRKFMLVTRSLYFTMLIQYIFLAVPPSLDASFSHSPNTRTRVLIVPFILIFFSFVRRTTTQDPTFQKGQSRMSGLVHTTSRALTIDTVANTLVHPLHK